MGHIDPKTTIFELSEKPFVSVIIPTYNSASFIKETIDSVLHQTFRDFEIIIVDDGSTDNTRKIVDHYGDKIHYIFQENAGSASARNKGIKASRGEWIAFLDSDDYWEDYHLEKLLDRHRLNQEADLVYCGKRWVDQDGSPIQDTPLQTNYPEGWIFRELFQHNYISTSSSVVARRSTLINLGGFDEAPIFSVVQDYDMWLRVSANSVIVSISELSVKYRRHENNLTLNTVNRVSGVLAALNNAAEMVRMGMVNESNYPERIIVQERMKRAYREAAVGLFHFDHYRALRTIGLEAIMRRYTSMDLLLRWILCYLPAKALFTLKRVIRYVK